VVRRDLRQQQQAHAKRVKVGIAVGVAVIFLGPVLFCVIARWWGAG